MDKKIMDFLYRQNVLKSTNFITSLGSSVGQTSVSKLDFDTDHVMIARLDT